MLILKIYIQCFSVFKRFNMLALAFLLLIIVIGFLLGGPIGIAIALILYIAALLVLKIIGLIFKLF